MRVSRGKDKLGIILTLLGIALSGQLAAGCNSLDVIGVPHAEIDVIVTGAGLGVGLVTSPAPADIYCTITAGHASGECHAKFDDAGGGGAFTLIATPATGSRFGGFHGCNSTSGLNCELTFGVGGGSLHWDVIATFDLEAAPPPGQNFVRFENHSHTLQAYLVGPGETPGPDNAVDPDHERLLAIPTAPGAPLVFRAYLPPATEVASQTCLVTATAWQNGVYPIVKFWDNEGHYLTCEAGLVAP